MGAPVANEFDIWILGVPFIDLAGDGEFNEWVFGVPVLDSAADELSSQPRRRCSIEDEV